MIELVVFDFDGTLSQTEEFTFMMENEIAYGMGYPPISRDLHRKLFGETFKDLISKGFPGVDVERFLKLVVERVKKESIDKKIDIVSRENLETLKKLRKSGKKLAILTSRRALEIEHLMHKSHPLSEYIEAFYHQSSSDYTKPDSRVFDKILLNFKVSSNNAVYVGDYEGDAVSAKGAGMHFIATLESGLRTKKDFEGLNVDFFVNKLPDILPYILNH